MSSPSVTIKPSFVNSPNIYSVSATHRAWTGAGENTGCRKYGFWSPFSSPFIYP